MSLKDKRNVDHVMFAAEHHRSFPFQTSSKDDIIVTVNQHHDDQQ
jgi:hypothetical protein